jgi:DNA (cytosine-5)-methyltransferase 1
MMLRILDLFSGIGGFSLGLERTGGFQTVAFCEIDPFCRRVLAKHWPEIPCYDDIRELTAGRLAADGIVPDVLCGGFPCQDVSRAGTGLGLKGERSGLWREYARLIREIRPRYVLVENVAALLDGGIADVLRDLASFGFDAEWSTVSACSMGAPHVRQRVFIVAYPNGQHGRQGFWDAAARSNWALQEDNRLAGARTGWRAWMANPSELYRGADGIADGSYRNHAIGNAVVPQIPELIGRAILHAESLRVAA